ncbi:MAG: NAD(P)-dependent alcohol dehydrogenase [Thermoactinospora sp.]|nr:NAD(P)-dependent alcohol dehydrogenase [Thermoactinospora sp.]
MKAWTWERYGSPDVLEMRDIDPPLRKEGEVLVRVRAASVNPYDWRHLRADPQFIRLYAGLRRPKPGSILGADLAGVVEDAPAGSAFRPGDEVFGDVQLGAFAELVCAPVGRLAPKPRGLTFEEAAALPMAGQTAMKALETLRPGQHVLVNGAAGGIGTCAVQLAKAAGAVVTGVCGTRNADLVRSIGADRVVDYTRTDFTRSGERYDLIVDLVGNHSLRRFRRALAPRGTLALVGGLTGGGRLFGPLIQILAGSLMTRFVRQSIIPITWEPGAESLRRLAAHAEVGDIMPVIDQVFQFAEVPEAVRHVESRHARGKVVIGGIA